MSAVCKSKDKDELFLPVVEISIKPLCMQYDPNFQFPASLIFPNMNLLGQTAKSKLFVLYCSSLSVPKDE